MIPVHPTQIRRVLEGVLFGGLLLAPLPIGVGIAHLLTFLRES